VADLCRGDGGDRLPSKKTRKILFNVCENNSSDRKLIFLHFGIHENAFDITKSVLIPHFLFILVSSHLISLFPTLWHLIAYKVLMRR